MVPRRLLATLRALRFVRPRRFADDWRLSATFALTLICVVTAGCAHRGAPPTPSRIERGWTENGIASWYGEPYHGRRTASGEIYDMHALTGAHKTLDFGTIVRVRRRDDGRHVDVRINDRGPFIEGRIIDLSYAAARKIGLDVDGVARVRIEVVGHAGSSRPTHDIALPGGETCFWVQVGAFAEKARAVAVEERLDRAGEHAVLLEGSDGLWRVRVGPCEDEADARLARDRLVESWPGAHIVPCG